LGVLQQTSSRDAPYRNSSRISTKAMNMLLYPLKSEQLVEQASIDNAVTKDLISS
jgi:hypothetical protein